MLKIFVNNQAVDLLEDIQINLTIENPFMQADRIPAPYSLSFTLPPTPNNLKIFNWPNRMTSYKVSQTFNCRILFQALTIAQGVLDLSPYDNSIRVNFRGITITEKLKDKLFNIDLGAYEFSGGETGMPDFDNQSNFGGKYKLLAARAANGQEDFVFGPVRVQTGTPLLPMIVGEPPTGRPARGQSVPGRPDDMMDSEYINFWNPKSIRASIQENTSPLPTGVANKYAHASIFPFPRVRYLFDCIFGDTLHENIFSSEELEDLIIINSFHPRWNNRNWNFFQENLAGMLFNNKPPFVPNPVAPPGTNYLPHFEIKTFMPNIPAIELVKDVLKIFCLSLFVRQDKFFLKFNRDILLDKTQIENWSSKLINQPVFGLSEVQSYKYGYEGYDKKEDSEGYFFEVENVRDVYVPVFTPDPSRPYDANEQQYRVASTKQEIKRWVTEERQEIEYEVISSDFGGNKDVEGASIDMVSRLKPLPMTIGKYWWERKLRAVDQPDIEGWHVPIWEGERKERPTESYIMFYRGMKQTFHAGTSYPYITPYNIDASGEKIGELSLSWEGNHGLIHKFHEEYKEWTEKSKVRFTTPLLLSPIDFQNLDLSKKKYINGRNFFIEKIQVTIRHNRIDPAMVDFLEA